jgi:hypothetical protein
MSDAVTTNQPVAEFATVLRCPCCHVELARLTGGVTFTADAALFCEQCGRISLALALMERDGARRPDARGGGGMRIHDLKCWPEPFAAVRDGSKTYELRVNDRDYRVGDVLRLREWDPRVVAQPEGWCERARGYTGEVEERTVTYMTPGGAWGLPDDLCVLALSTPPDAGARRDG